MLTKIQWICLLDKSYWETTQQKCLEHYEYKMVQRLTESAKAEAWNLKHVSCIRPMIV